jgi:hypothetical protein
MYNPKLSLFIPRVTKNTTERQIKDVFKKLDLGLVSRVDFVEKQDNKDILTAFVHFSFWFDTTSAYHLQEHIFNHQQGKIVYADPSYWILMENKNPRSEVEIELEKKVKELEKHIKYLNGVISVHTKKFVDNNITLKTIYCDTCFASVPANSVMLNCPACEMNQVNDIPENYLQAPNNESDCESIVDSDSNLQLESIEKSVYKSNDSEVNVLEPETKPSSSWLGGWFG